MKYAYTTDATARFLPEENGDYLIHRTKVSIIKKGDSVFAHGVIDVHLDSDSGEEYIIVRQLNDEEGEIRIFRDEWPVIRKVIDAMVARCRVEREEKK